LVVYFSLRCESTAPRHTPRNNSDWIGNVRAEPIQENFLSLESLGDFTSIELLIDVVLHALKASRRKGFFLKALSTT
jgi:hypothetical protein